MTLTNLLQKFRCQSHFEKPNALATERSGVEMILMTFVNEAFHQLFLSFLMLIVENVEILHSSVN